MCDEGSNLNNLGGLFSLKDIKESLAIAESLAKTAMMTSPAAKRRLMARKLEMGLDSELEFVPPKQVLLYLVRMGSFTSTVKIENPDSADEDVCGTFEPTTHAELIDRCRREIESVGRPPLLRRKLQKLQKGSPDKRPFLRFFQWNVLSQTLGVSIDNFIKSPNESLDWQTRRFYILQEIIQHDPDVICLEEVDHYNFLESSLRSVGYVGKFLPKPDSPCVYIEKNNGPDGAALFFRSSKFELVSWESRILEVWHVQSNQVALACILREKETAVEFCVAVTHLKAKSGALLATLRDHQGRDLLDWLKTVSAGRPILIGGDFNAEPTEPVYKTMTSHKLNLKSGYCVQGKEPAYTTWKIREEGEICHTIDYIFHSNFFAPVAQLDFPDGSAVGPGRVPSLNYPSDHFSLINDFEINVNSNEYIRR